MPHDAFDTLSISIIAAACGATLLLAAAARPRVFLYLIFALTPTQFLFIPVSDFFTSPADVLILAAASGLALRTLNGERHAWLALRQHRFIGLMVCGYVLGFLILGYFSRTFVRVLIAVVPSILACELIRTRKQLVSAASALVVGGMIDAGYGLFYYANGIWLYPTRFSGMSGVNFSAMVITTAAVVGYAKVARTKQPVKLLGPSVLVGFGAATLSQMGLLALVTSWATVLNTVFTRANRILLFSGVVAVGALTLTQDAIVDRVRNRNQAERLLEGSQRTSEEIRLVILRKAWQSFTERPFVGLGYLRFQEFSTTDPEIRSSTGGQGYGTHNTYVEILVEGGLLALIPFLVHFSQYARGLRLVWPAIAREHDLVTAASVAGLPVVAISAGLANVLIHYSFWAVCGLGLACINILKIEAMQARATTLKTS
jgi:O-antigen ligase